MRESFRDLPITVRIYVVILALAYFGAIWALPQGRPLIIAGLVGIFTMTGVVKPVPNPSGGVNVPIMGVIIVAALLWTPQEVLIGVGIGSFLGLLVFRSSEVWRAALNGALWGLPAAAAAYVAHWTMLSVTLSLISLSIAAVFAVIADRVLNMGLFAVYRNQRFGLPFLADWWHNVSTNWSSQLLSAPMAIVLAWITLRMENLIPALALTALSAIGLPVARQELAYYQRSQEMMDEIVEAVVRTLEGVYPLARTHGDNVAELAVETGRKLGMAERELLTLRLASRLHDVGLLSESEGRYLEEHHAVTGSRILARFPDPVIAKIVRAHHDRWDGKDNLDNLAKDTIPLGARILAAAETFDSAQKGLYPFEAPLSRQEAESHLISQADSALDPKVVKALLEVVAEKSRKVSAVG